MFTYCIYTCSLLILSTVEPGSLNTGMVMGRINCSQYLLDSSLEFVLLYKWVKMSLYTRHCSGD